MDDLISDFAIEAAEALAELQAGVAALALRREVVGPATEMLRRLHGLKGLCGFVGCPRSESLAHSAESLLDALVQSEPPPAWAALGLVGDVVARLAELIGAVSRTGHEPEGSDEALITALELSAASLRGVAYDPASVPAPSVVRGLPVGLAAVAAESGERRARSPWCGLDTLARALGDRLGKRIDLVVGGDDLRMSLNAAPRLRSALIALVRNACDHGVEAPAERRAVGKPPLSVLQLTIRRTARGCAIDLIDDGRGVDPNRLRDACRAHGLGDARALATLADADVQQLVFSPGVTTAQSLTALSGRGLGLDLVRGEVEALGGGVEMVSAPGRGARFTLTLPASALATAADRRRVVAAA